MLMIVGPAKVAGAVVLALPRLPRLPRLKEWTYAGFAFSLVGAIASHIFNAASLAEVAPPIPVLAVLIGSYMLRPADRRL